MELNQIIDEIIKEIHQPIWEHWYIKEKIGSGAYSAVFKVEARRSATRVNYAALKIQPITANGRAFVNDDDKKAYIERQKERSDREAEIMLGLRRFPNIVFYEDEDVRQLTINGRFEGYYSLLRMELLTPIVDLIHKRHFDFSQQNILKLASDIGKGIADAHSVGIIHRDIKLDNFFVDDYGTYKIGDFNVAKASATARTMAGTPGYIAPEVYQAKSDVESVYTGQADIYSLGICLYRLMNNMFFPFEDTTDTENAHSKRNRGEKLPPPKNAGADFAKIILKACEYSTIDRYHSMTDMLNDIAAIKRNVSYTDPSSRLSSDPEMTILAEEPINYGSSTSNENDSKIEIKGRTIEFGAYYGTATGAKKPIRWRVLSVEKDHAVIITEDNIDAMHYSSSSDMLFWEDSDIRQFLNSNFYDNAFSDKEKQMILSSEIPNYKNVVFRTNSGNKTTDRVYLLSIEEAARLFDGNPERIAAPTSYALSKGLFTSNNGKAWWWLRSSGNLESYASDVDYGGDVDSYGSDKLVSLEGIRPVIRVSLSLFEEEELLALSQSISSHTDSISSFDPITKGDVVSFGEYFADSEFIKKPLYWQVLEVNDSNQALIITKDCIDARPFDTRKMNLSWKQCELRRWLNNEFLELALNGDKALMSKISSTKHSTPANKVFSVTGGMDVLDRVFLLDLDEAKRLFADNSSRQAQAVPYAKQKSLFTDANGCVWWWLRSPGNNQQYAANVDYGGDVDYYGSDTTVLNGVRPVMWVDISVLKKI